MTRVFSGIKPTGALHIGNYLGAVRQWVADQYEYDSLYCVVDLHALTVEQDPDELRRRTLATATGLLAAGLDPDVCLVFVQSHVSEHTELCWILSGTTTFGELRRMTQFKEKSGGGQESVSAGLFTYPVLMAADILLYDTDRVPVGDDQRQHVELARDIALRFNNRYGSTFVVPEAFMPPVAARVMDLQHPDRKMSKSEDSPLGTIDLLDEPAEIERKIRRAVTDTGTDVRYDPETRPGLANLLEIFGAVTDRTPAEAAAGYERYGPLKADLAEALIEALRPVQERYAALLADQAAVSETLAKGAAKAAALAGPTLGRARDAVGLLRRG